MLPEDQTKTSCAVGSLSYLVRMESLVLRRGARSETIRTQTDRLEKLSRTKSPNAVRLGPLRRPKDQGAIEVSMIKMSLSLQVYMRFSLDGYMTDIVVRTARHQIQNVPSIVHSSDFSTAGTRLFQDRPAQGNVIQSLPFSPPRSLIELNFRISLEQEMIRAHLGAKSQQTDARCSTRAHVRSLTCC
ncbi:hypothetical protein Landi51_00654 [Colletotrichum acutatum]